MPAVRRHFLFCSIMIPIEELKNMFPAFEPGLLEEMAEHCSIRTVGDGEMLMKTGQYIRSAMIILSGHVKVYREDDEGSEFFIYFIEPGEACAISMICGGKQNISELTAKASGEVELVTVPLVKMDQWMMQYRSWYEFVLGTYRRRFMELLTTVDHVAFRNMDERLVFYLKQVSEKLGTRVIPYTHAEIAAELNSSREVISRLMKKLAERGMVRTDRQHIEILDLGKI